jgi:hypothetical protein
VSAGGRYPSPDLSSGDSSRFRAGEVEKPDPVCPFRVSGVDPEDEARYRAPSTLMESDVFFEAFANLRSR